MNTGKVKFFNNTKGFGFVKCHEDGKDYFVHSTGLQDQIEENDEVEFVIEEGRKGLHAVQVKRV